MSKRRGSGFSRVDDYDDDFDDEDYEHARPASRVPKRPGVPRGVHNDDTPAIKANPKARPTNNALLYKAYFRWPHYPFKSQAGSHNLPTETDACASVTAAFLQVLQVLHSAELLRNATKRRNVLQLLSTNTRRTKVVELSSGTHRVPDELKKHFLSDGAGGQYSTNLDRNRYGSDDNYLFTVVRYDLEFLGLCPCSVDVEIIDAKVGTQSVIVSAGPEACACSAHSAGGVAAAQQQHVGDVAGTSQHHLSGHGGATPYVSRVSAALHPGGSLPTAGSGHLAGHSPLPGLRADDTAYLSAAGGGLLPHSGALLGRKGSSPASPAGGTGGHASSPALVPPQQVGLPPGGFGTGAQLAAMLQQSALPPLQPATRTPSERNSSPRPSASGVSQLFDALVMAATGVNGDGTSAASPAGEPPVTSPYAHHSNAAVPNSFAHRAQPATGSSGRGAAQVMGGMSHPGGPTGKVKALWSNLSMGDPTDLSVPGSRNSMGGMGSLQNALDAFRAEEEIASQPLQLTDSFAGPHDTQSEGDVGPRPRSRRKPPRPNSFLGSSGPLGGSVLPGAGLGERVNMNNSLALALREKSDENIKGNFEGNSARADAVGGRGAGDLRKQHNFAVESDEDDNDGLAKDDEYDPDALSPHSRVVPRQSSAVNLATRVANAELRRLAAEVEALRSENQQLEEGAALGRRTPNGGRQSPLHREGGRDAPSTAWRHELELERTRSRQLEKDVSAMRAEMVALASARHRAEEHSNTLLAELAASRQQMNALLARFCALPGNMLPFGNGTVGPAAATAADGTLKVEAEVAAVGAPLAAMRAIVGAPASDAGLPSAPSLQLKLEPQPTAASAVLGAASPPVALSSAQVGRAPLPPELAALVMAPGTSGSGQDAGLLGGGGGSPGSEPCRSSSEAASEAAARPAPLLRYTSTAATASAHDVPNSRVASSRPPEGSSLAALHAKLGAKRKAEGAEEEVTKRLHPATSTNQEDEELV